MTVGWQYELDRDRYEESRPNVAPPILRLRCPYCRRQFTVSLAFDRHLRFDHPLESPVLYFDGNQAPREFTVRAPALAGSMRVCNATSCRYRMQGEAWQEVSTSSLLRQMGTATIGTFEIRLLHSREESASTVESKYCLHYRIPEASLQKHMDDAFVKLLAVERPDHAELRQFEAMFPEDLAVREYAAALENYVIALILKEGRGHTSPTGNRESYGEKMSEALGVLDCFSSPVARLVCACIRFNLNDFGATGSNPLDPRLDRASALFRSLIDSPKQEPLPYRLLRGCPRSMCPTDRVTDAVLNACEVVAGKNLPKRSSLEDLEALLEQKGVVREHDAIKIHVLCAHGFLRLRAPEAKRHLNEIRFNSVFGPWAQHKLKEI